MTPQRGDPTAAQTVRFYDAEASTYEDSRYASAPGRRVDAFHKRVLDLALLDAVAPDARLLEIGCGTGRLLRHVGQRTRQGFGVDASLGMLRHAQRERSGAGLVQGSAYALPYADASFDGAYAILVLNLLEHLPRALAEIARVLRPGARFLFNVPNLASVYWPGGLYVNLRRRTTGHNRAGFRYSHWFTRAEVRHALDAAGLRIAGCYGQPPLLRLGWTVTPLPAAGAGAALCSSLYFVAEKDVGR